MPPAHAPSQLAYLVYGKNPDYSLEARFSILTALRGEEAPRILLYTDSPADYDGWPVEVIALDKATLADWTGADGYIHRRKACAIRDALQYADVSIFVDTDTCFLQPAKNLVSLAKSAAWLVDKIEARWGDWSHLPIYQHLAPLLRKKYGVGEQMLLINSGVLGLQGKARPIQNETIRLIDELYPLAPDIHIIEQFAVAVAARDFPRPAQSKDIVRHYYSEKEYWRAMIRCFFARHGTHFDQTLLAAACAVPSSRPKPGWRHRLVFKIKSIGLNRLEKRPARLAYYAVHLPDNPYAQACGLEYCKAMAKLSPELARLFSSRALPARWRRLFNKADCDTLAALLEQCV